MGVHSLWKILEPTSRAVRLESLNRKKMAIDASIWIYQFLKAVRDKSGTGLKRSHIVGFFRRICKLIYFGILPVFVFDGGAPLLKRETVRKRKERRLGKREGAERTARRLLALQLQKKQAEGSKKSEPLKEDEIKEYHYLEDLDKTQDQLDQEARMRFKSTDEYHLPHIKGFEHTKDDTRIINAEDERELKSIAEQVDELDGIDLNTIDPASPEFSALPLSTQYMILSQLRLRSRLRMGYSKEQLENIFPDSKDFSKFQIEMVQKRNYFTQRLMNISGMDTSGMNTDERTDQIRRVVGERGKSYRIQKNEGGWSLSLNDEGTTSQRAIDLEKEELKKYQEKKPFERDEDEDEDEDDDIEWEDVSLEPTEKKKVNYSISALPLPPAVSVFGEQGTDSSAKAFSFSPVKDKSKKSTFEDEEENDNDEVLKQIEEIELIEAVQRSKAELKKQQELEQELIYETIKEKNDDVAKPVSDNVRDKRFFEDSPFDLPELKDSNTSSSTVPAAAQKPQFLVPKVPNLQNMKLRSEMDHLLNMNPQILNFQKKKDTPPPLSSNDDGQKQGVLEESTSEGRMKEQPSWFIEQFENPYKKSSNSTSKLNISKSTGNGHTNTKEKSNSNNTGEFVSFYEVQEILKNKREADVNEEDIEVIEPVTIDDDEEEEEEEDTTVQNEVESVEVSKDKRTECDNDESAAGDENNRDANVEKEKGKEEEKEEGKEEPIDYEFYESDEERLQQQLEKEEEEHEQFQKDLNPHIIKTLSIDDLDDSESILKEQRKKELRDSDEVTQEMVKEVQELLACFGIPYITAPMEAEAQCAELLKLGLVDGIVTDDSDVFLFAGGKVYKNMFHEKNYVEFYNDRDIERELGLDRSNFISLAHLLGSDYAEGLKGIGPVSSMEILAHFGTLEKFRDWFNEGQFDVAKQSKETSFEKNLRNKLVKNEIILDKTFPDARINHAYLQPEVDHDKTAFVWGSPDLDKLRTYLMMNIGWGQDKVDQVLVPLIRDLNQKKRTGLQSTLNEFYAVDDLNYYQNSKTKKNKRMSHAKEKIKKRKTGK